ncbi:MULTISPECIES: CPBP family intramembrane glutamic endopeptidase [Cyanophyceae]|uniref:CPBP family intramembrane glutamic endopeptidase n=1 Tax=Cyanophyceae TaxID=3028117 RepID=UPI0018EFFE46|nr:type II CAAX endopeptidase family protein [Trichocoleus sp. FACHB-40]
MFKLNLVRLAQYPAPVRLGLFVLSLLSIWLPLAAPIYIFVKDSNLVTILTMGLLFVEFLLLVRFWGQNVYQQSHLLRSYGLQGTRRNGLELLSGLGVGVIITFSLFWLEGLLGWLVWQSPTVVLPRLVVEGLASALGIGLAEELVFRGWLLDELERDYRPRLVLWADVLIFALLHFLKPPAEILRTLPGFPGLILFGLTLVWAKRGSKGRLGLSIGLHAGMVWGYYIINVGQMVQYSGRVSDWITGVDKNPLAGAMGLMFLGVLALLMRMRSRSPKISS